MDDSEDDVLAYLAFPAQHTTKLHSTNPLERLGTTGPSIVRLVSERV
jgi:transposase-like protein